jgi:hypothetical protein
VKKRVARRPMMLVPISIEDPAKLIELTNEEILADLVYPEPLPSADRR